MESGGALAIGMRDDRAPIESGGVQLVASSAAQPPRRSRVALRADGAPVEEKGRRKIGGAPPRPCQSRVAMSGKIDEKRRAKSGGTHVATSSTAVPPRQSKAALSGSGAPIKEKTSMKSGSTQAATSSTAPPQIWSIVVMSGIGAPIEEKTRSNSGSKQAAKPSLWRRVATFGASVETAPPLLRSRVASLAELAPNKENRRRTKSHSTQAATSSTAVPPHQSKVAICGSGATIKEKTRSKSCSTQAAASSTAPPLHQSRVPMSVSGVPNKEKRRTKSCSTQAAASSMDPPLHQSRVPMSVSGVSVEEKRRTKSLMPKPPRRSKVALSANGRPVDGVRRADVIEYYKHCDGSIYRQTDFLSKLYRLHDTNETGLEPMMRSEPSDDCSVNWRACERHANCTMMQIFSLKLAYPPAGDQVKVYGFMAVRDTKDHLRNYIFNRTRDDPFIVEQEDGFIQLSGPKRGIWWYDKQLVEFDMRIKRGENEADDLQIIDGAVWFYDGCSPHARVLTQRIDGDYGSVDISYTRLLLAMEATVQIAVSELDRDIGLLVRAFYVSDLLHQGMQLFDGVIPADAGGADRYELDKYVVAASRHTKLALQLRIRSLDDDGDVWRSCLSPASTHGTDDFSFALSFTTIDVKISWSTLD